MNKSKKQPRDEAVSVVMGTLLMLMITLPAAMSVGVYASNWMRSQNAKFEMQTQINEGQIEVNNAMLTNMENFVDYLQNITWGDNTTTTPPSADPPPCPDCPLFSLDNISWYIWDDDKYIEIDYFVSVNGTIIYPPPYPSTPPPPIPPVEPE